MVRDAAIITQSNNTQSSDVAPFVTIRVNSYNPSLPTLLMSPPGHTHVDKWEEENWCVLFIFLCLWSLQTSDAGSSEFWWKNESVCVTHCDVISEHKIDNTPNWERGRERIPDKMPVRVVQSEVSPPLPVNSKQVRTSIMRPVILLFASILARGVPHSPLQRVQIHRTSEVQRKSVWRWGYVTGDIKWDKILFFWQNIYSRTLMRRTHTFADI